MICCHNLRGKSLRALFRRGRLISWQSMSEPAPIAESAATAQSGPTSAWWRLPLLLAIVLAAIVVARSSQNGLRGPLSVAESSPPPGTSDSGKTVALEIDYGDGRK